jgi:hypothetical protein
MVYLDLSKINKKTMAIVLAEIKIATVANGKIL